MHIPARGHWQQQWDQTNTHLASGTDSPSYTSRLQQPSSTASLGALWVGVDNSWASRRRRRQIKGGLAGGKLDEELGLTYSPVGQTSRQAPTSWETRCDYLIPTAANTELPPTKYKHSCLDRPRHALAPKMSRHVQATHLGLGRLPRAARRPASASLSWGLAAD